MSMLYFSILLNLCLTSLIVALLVHIFNTYLNNFHLSEYVLCHLEATTHEQQCT
jgi:hypothetical protein